MPIPLTEVQLFTNNAVTLLAVPLSSSDTSMVVMTGYGAQFPSPGPNQYFLVTLEDQAASTREIIKVTGRSGDTFTGLVRGQEGTTPQSWGASLGNDTLVDHRITAETMMRAMQLPVSAGGGGATTLDQLTDVTLTAPTSGQVLKYNGSQWVNQPDNTFVPGSINAFTDVDTASTPPSVGQVLKWNGTNWVPSPDVQGVTSLGSIDGHTDVDTTTVAPMAGQVLKWNGLNWAPANDTVGVIGSIDQHTDVDTSSVPPTVGQILKWNGTNWVPSNDESVTPKVINSLDDVDTVSVPPQVGYVLKWNGTNWVPSTDNDTVFDPSVVSINAFADVNTTTVPPVVGYILTWNGTQWIPAAPAASSGGPASWIHGANIVGTNIDSGWQVPISTADYDVGNRTFKFIVTVVHDASFTTRAFEVLLTITGNLGTNSEIVHATQYATVGPSVSGDLHATLDTGAKTLSLEWENTEASPVTVHVTRIQHFPV